MQTHLSPPEKSYAVAIDDRALNHFAALQCPACKAAVDNLNCATCSFRMESSNKVIHALLPDRRSYYSRFIRDYETIRAAEGRGSLDTSFYLSLPYADTTGRNSSQWKIREKSYGHLVRHVLKPLGNRCLILDLGAGNGWMSYRLALAGYKPVAVDLLTNQHDGLGAATHFDAHLSEPFLWFQAEVQNLPFRNGQFDAVIFNASFHYAEDYNATLREALRCAKPGGMVIISDTPLYDKEESGEQMVAERRAAFQKHYGTASDSLKSIQYVTPDRLRDLESTFGIHLTVHRPWYGLSWSMRPWVARLRRRRKPSRFCIFVARKNG